tara:strand:+ start:1434 stop:1679 length:246 start_codon:yes stop_codon:yes gene_type:complete
MSNSKLEVSSLEWQRDEDSNALVSVDRNALMSYKKRKLLMKSKNDRIDEMSDHINSLRQDMTELKDILMQVINSKQETNRD